jgi:hypothetical protein
MRKIFEVIIHDNPFDVYDIDGKEHAGDNGEPKSWWLYHSQRMPPGTNPPIDSPHWVPFHSRINRRVWEFRIKQRNTTKEKWGETQFRNNTCVEMICNGKPVYEFSTTGNPYGLAYAMSKIQYLIVRLEEHPYNFFNPEKESGRKIYWKGLPATVKPSFHPGEIYIVPDYTAGLTKDQWWNELRQRERFIPAKQDDFSDTDEDGPQSEYINWGDALSDGHIDWFRK